VFRPGEGGRGDLRLTDPFAGVRVLDRARVRTGVQASSPIVVIAAVTIPAMIEVSFGVGSAARSQPAGIRSGRIDSTNRPR
jgi:hypothetical protein